ncbi:MAG: hypothetical protein IK121_03135 [Lachnospiraceae bacterium]|nr:hypothetical protein [Lachnospiraceae bacterium]
MMSLFTYIIVTFIVSFRTLKRLEEKNDEQPPFTLWNLVFPFSFIIVLIGHLIIREES